MSTRLANRSLTDALVDDLLGRDRRWTYLTEIASDLGWTRHRVVDTVILLEHGYGAVRYMRRSGAVLLVDAGLERYRDGDRTRCTCPRCPGEHER